MRRLSTLAAAALALATFASAQTARPPASPAHGYRIAGRVIDSVTGEPVPRATVRVLARSYDGALASAVTGPDGRFAFENIPAGKYPLQTAKRGYRTTFYDEHENFNSAIVTGDGLDTGNLDVHLAPDAVLRGVITDDAGDPVEGAQVTLFKQPISAGIQMQQAGSAETDDTGAYEFAGLPSGVYMVAVSAEPWYAQHRAIYMGGRSEPSPLDVAYPMTFYDSTIDQSAAKPIPLDAGSREQADITLHAVPAVHFLVPSGPRGISRFSLTQQIFGTSMPVRVPPLMAENQQIEILGIAPGSYDADVGNPPRHMIFNASSSQDANLSGGTPTVTLSGSLAIAGGGAAPPFVAVNLVRENGGGEQLAANAQNGSFRLDAVLPGTYMLNAGAPGLALAVVSTTMENKVTPGPQIVVGDHPPSIFVTLARAQVDIQGFARKVNTPAPGVMIVLVPADARNFPALVRRDQSDSDGSFELRGVAPGAYTLVAIEDGWKLDWQDRQALAPYLRNGIRISVSEQSGPVMRLAQPVPTQERSR